MTKKIVSLFLTLITVTTVASACVRQPVEPQASRIAAGVVMAMSKVKTYSLDCNITDNSTTEPLEGPRTESSSLEFSWLGHDQALVNLADNATWFSYKLSQGPLPITAFVGQFYLVGGWRYWQESSPRGIGPLGPMTGWDRMKLPDAYASSLFANIAQLAPLMELFQSGTQVSLAGEQQADGVQCYALTTNPTATAAADWIDSQNKGDWSTTALYISNAGWQRSREIYIKAYVGGQLRLMVDRKSLRIIQADINLHFVVTPEDLLPEDFGGMNPTVPTTSEDVIDFHGQSGFSDYGRKLSIVPPAGALNTPAQSPDG